ncbi:MAG: shikimate dehydrogenase [Kiritimatiellia bacterium]|nr:shikimate dehydrogenase [Kiritimatiellia bacterium]
MNEFHIDMPTGHTTPYAVLGHPIGHTLSPLLHNTAFAHLGWKAIYLAFDVLPDRIGEVLQAMRDMGFRGVNLTIPLKEAAFACLDRRDASAQLVQSVNTVEFTPGGLIGHSTDGDGFLRATREAFGEGPEGRSFFVLGAGGAGRAVALTAAAAGAASVVLTDVDSDRARRVAREIRDRCQACEARAVPADQAETSASACDWIVQATPLGLRPDDPLPLPPRTFHPAHRVFDLVYGRADTPTTRAAREAGARASTGLDMLLYQGVRSFEIWTGQTPPVDLLRSVLRKAVERT